MAPLLFFLVIFLVVDGDVKQFPYKDQGVTLTFPTKALCDKTLVRVSNRAIKEGLIPNRDFAMVCMEQDDVDSRWVEEEFIHRHDQDA
jgi:hypothetical protein